MEIKGKGNGLTEEMIKQSRRTMRGVATEFARKLPHIGLDEFLSECNLGLVLASKKFDPVNNAKHREAGWSKYAYYWMRMRCNRFSNLTSKTSIRAGDTVTMRVLTAEKRLGIKLSPENVGLFEQELNGRYSARTTAKNILRVYEARGQTMTYLDASIGEDSTLRHEITPSKVLTPEECLIGQTMESSELRSVISKLKLSKDKERNQKYQAMILDMLSEQYSNDELDRRYNNSRQYRAVILGRVKTKMKTWASRQAKMEASI